MAVLRRVETPRPLKNKNKLSVRRVLHYLKLMFILHFLGDSPFPLAHPSNHEVRIKMFGLLIQRSSPPIYFYIQTA